MFDEPLMRITDDRPAIVRFLAEQIAVDDLLATTPREQAEVIAKRRIVGEHPCYRGRWCATCQHNADELVEWPCYTLRSVASVYADHPDYLPEWK